LLLLVELGEDVGEALNMKLTGNMMLLSFSQVMAEGLTLAAATGEIDGAGGENLA
jgi:3-hydroxyisobutyrate dehydrogenase-like beta-hydroxyacid dehydrogenase